MPKYFNTDDYIQSHIQPIKDIGKGDPYKAWQDSQGASVGHQLQKGFVQGDSAKQASDAQKEIDQRLGEQFQQNSKYSGELSRAGSSYLGSMQGNVDKYQGDLDVLRNEAEGAQRDTRNTYSNDIQPRMKDLMERAHQNASSAMSLKDAMDPNNSVAQATRKLYETQAQGENKEGLANAATLQALGAQNFGTQVSGGLPMTGGQLAALMGQNQAAAGSAYGNTQRRIQGLRDQGLEQGFRRSDIAYNQGRQAVNDYGQSVGNFEGAMDRQNARDVGFRGERGGYGSKTYDLQQQLAGAQRDVSAGNVQRNMANYNNYISGLNAGSAGKIAQAGADQAQRAQMLGGLMQVGGTVAGAAVGGPGGAKAGGDLAKADATNTANNSYYQSPYGGQSAPANYVESGSANQGYGGVSGTYGDAGGAYPGLGLTDMQQQPDYAAQNRASLLQRMRYG